MRRSGITRNEQDWVVSYPPLKITEVKASKHGGNVGGGMALDYAMSNADGTGKPIFNPKVAQIAVKLLLGLSLVGIGIHLINHAEYYFGK